MARKPKKSTKGAKTKAAETAEIEKEAAENAGSEGMEAHSDDAAMPEGEGPMLRILAQYMKDSSFENPHAPDSLRSGQEPPSVDLNIGSGRNVNPDNTIEVILGVKAEARRDDKTVFIAEVEYAGLFTFNQTSVDQLEPLIAIECPRLLFPTVRNVIAQMTMDGGYYPPLRIDPPDFVGMFRDEMMRRAAEQGNIN